nr:RCC1 and BTB domain-containing protein 1-like isoform X1 [Nomia melanderi]
MYLRNWPIFDFLEPTFRSKIHMVLVYGDLGNEALIVTQDKWVYAIGTNKSSCLGTGDTCNAFYPKLVESLCNKDIKTFAYGKGPHVLALTHAGEVYSWGSNISNELGNISAQGVHESSTPSLVQILSSDTEFIVDIACGSYHSMALSNIGEVYAWGKNHCGQAGLCANNDTEKRSKKVNVLLKNKKFICISCGDSSSTAVTDNGEVYTWGDNSVGQLGTGNNIDLYSDKPCQVTKLTGVVIKKVTCGGWHTLALSDEGILFVWGDNSHGQLGISSSNIVWTPVMLTMPKMIKVLDIASSHSTNISIAMGDSNQIFIWGSCLGQYIKAPTLTSVRCIYDAFANYATPRVMHKPLILHEDKTIHILQSLKDAFNDPSTSDLIIQVKGNPIYVHKFILKIRSHHYKTMFQKQSVENDQCIIKEDQFSHDVYITFLKYLYTDEIDNLSPIDILAELLNLANIYSESQLQRRCLQIIIKRIRVSNVACLYGTAIAYNIKAIEESCFKFALNHMTAVIETPSFAELNETIVKAFIIKAAKAGAFKT